MGHRSIPVLLLAASLWGANWPQWRGPSANGISDETRLPVKWSATDNIAWKAPLKGLGTSTPIVWGDRIFLTAQLGDGPYEGRSRDFQNAAAAKRMGDSGKVEFVVLAFSRIDGRQLWEHRFAAEGNLAPVHVKHNLASPSCVTDGELVYAWFGTGQLVALTLDGKPAWQKHMGKEYAPFDVLWGHGSSPFLYKNSVLLLCDHAKQGYLVSLDKKTGKQLWKADRGAEIRSYTTPFLVKGAKSDELIINSSRRVEALDPSTGELLWHASNENRVPVPTPVWHEGVMYLNRGYNSSPYLAVKTGGRGDVSASHTLWQVNTGGPYVSSLLYYQGLLYMATETGIASCVDAKDGKTLWKERFGGVFSASPVAADGKVYLVNENGEAWVLAAGRELKIVEKNVLPERTLASPAIAGGRIFLRTDEHLVAIGK